MNKVIFGGGFDPVHLGHINMALVARDALNADVFFVPASISVWKNDSVSAEHKLNMLKLAIKDHVGLFIDEYEIKQDHQPYSFETISYFKKKYPNDRLFLLIGQDQANSFHLWKEAEKIAKMAQIVYFKRPKVELNKDNIEKYRMLEITGKEIEVSSTDVRNLKSVNVPESVLRYIEDNDLYFIKKIKEKLKESRYIHSLSVAHLAYNIAKKQNLDYQKAYIAGILHDIAKYYDKNESLNMMKKYYPDFVSIGSFSYHQFLGEKIAKEEFMVVDEEILNAIKYHTTGKKAMNWLEKLIYAVDKIDPTRGYDSSDLLKAVEEDLEKGFLTVLKANVDFLESKNINMNNRLTEECLDYYLKDSN